MTLSCDNRCWENVVKEWKKALTVLQWFSLTTIKQLGDSWKTDLTKQEWSQLLQQWLRCPDSSGPHCFLWPRMCQWQVLQFWLHTLFRNLSLKPNSPVNSLILHSTPISWVHNAGFQWKCVISKQETLVTSLVLSTQTWKNPYKSHRKYHTTVFLFFFV